MIMKQFLLCSLLLAAAACNNTGQTATQGGDSSRRVNNSPAHVEPTAAVIDTPAVIAAFELLKSDTLFLDKLHVRSETIYDFFDEERPLLIGDINNDQQPDALMPFALEGVGGGNYYEVYYAVFLNRNGALKMDTLLFRGSKRSETTLTLTGIANGAIEGWETARFPEEEGDSIYVQYQFRNGKLEETVREN